MTDTAKACCMACPDKNADDTFAAMKQLIKLADTFEEADGYLNEFCADAQTGAVPTVAQKLAFLYAQFSNVHIVAATDADDDPVKKEYNNYVAVLHAIINLKRR